MTKATAYWDTITIPTYEILKDDLNPIYDKRAMPYPYTMQDHTAKTPVDKEYPSIVLENEYLKLIVLPTLGAHLYSALDKRTGIETFYRNPVIKPRLISVRGAWFAGGIEFNFPISHSTTTMDRVNATIHHYEDGSASVTFGAIEQISYMNWKFELRIYPDKAYIEQNTYLYNPTAQSQRFYVWTNTAIEYTPNMKLIYPFDWCTTFGAKYIKWPYAEDNDCSNPGEVPSSYETFGKLLNDNFCGAYNFDKNYGLVHYADRKRVKGAKFFMWGNDSLAKVWNRALVQEGDEYLEIQSGPFESQRVFKLLRPHQELVWSEYWYQVPDMGGCYQYAEKSMAVRYVPIEGGIRFVFAPCEKNDDCTISVKYKGKEYSAVRSFHPDRLETVDLMLDDLYQIGEKFVLDVYSKDAHLMNLGQREEFIDEVLDVDLYEDARTAIPPEEQQSKHFLMGLHNESFGYFKLAADAYERAQDELIPGCKLADTALGRIYLKQRLFEKAKGKFLGVLRYDNRNAEARFGYAAALRGQGDIVRARRLFMDISIDSPYFAASALEMAKCNLALGYYQDTLELLSGYVGKGNLYADFLMSVTLRKDGFAPKALALTGGAAAQANEYLLCECFLITGSDEAREALTGFTSSDQRELLALALEYVDIGQTDDAAALVGLIANPDMRAELLKWDLKRRGASIEAGDRTQVLSGCLDYVFFNEPYLLGILEEIRAEDATGVADYLYGVWQLAKCDYRGGLDSLLRAYQKGCRYTVLLYSIGYAYMTHLGAPEKARPYLEEDVFEGAELNDGSLVLLERIYRAAGEMDNRERLLPYFKRVENRSFVLGAWIDVLRDAGLLDDAYRLLTTEAFENWEGQEGSGPLYRSVLMALAAREKDAGNYQKARVYVDQATQYPASLHYGDHARTVLADWHYLRGEIYMLCGDAAAAREAFRMGAREIDKPNPIQVQRMQPYIFKCMEAYKRMML